MVFVDGVHDDPEEVVEHLRDCLRGAAFREPGGFDQVDEKHGRFDHVSRQRCPLAEGALCDVGPDVASEQVT